MLNLLNVRRIPVAQTIDGQIPALDAVERLLMRAARRLLFEDDADSPLWDLPLPQIRALHVIAYRQHCAVGHLAERLGVAMSTATQIADRLEQRSWVRRVDDPEDRRIVRLALTDEGRWVVEERRRSRRERLKETMAKMPGEKREALLEGLRALVECSGGSGCERRHKAGNSLLSWVREDLETEAPVEEATPSRALIPEAR
jgi:DNA-binding MarR family transcriptional regulator